MTVKIVSKKDPITTDHPKTSAVFKSNPIALSQIKCLTPPKKWYQMAQSEQSNARLKPKSMSQGSQSPPS